MKTGCNRTGIGFRGHEKRKVTGAFDGGRLSPDGGALPLREADPAADVTRRLAKRFTDHRDPERI